MKKFNYLVVIVMVFGALLASCDDKKEFVVSFNSNGGSAVLQQIVKEGKKVVKPDDPTRDGYAFVAWFKEAAFANEWRFDADVVIGDISLYAKWELNVFIVSFDSNEGSAVLQRFREKIFISL